MDGVFVDFDKGAALVHGKDPAVVREKRSQWSIAPVLGCKDLNEFWAPIHANEHEFWLNLEPFPWFRKLIDWVDKRAETWRIVTSPSRMPASYSGKAAWLKKHFGEHFEDFHITGNKADFANDDTVLIDDRPQNNATFVAAGGHAILFPAHGNHGYETVNQWLLDGGETLGSCLLGGLSAIKLEKGVFDALQVPRG
jgi:5'(3')-deoxyribonucleotidase